MPGTATGLPENNSRAQKKLSLNASDHTLETSTYSFDELKELNGHSTWTTTCISPIEEEYVLSGSYSLCEYSLGRHKQSEEEGKSPFI